MRRHDSKVRLCVRPTQRAAGLALGITALTVALAATEAQPLTPCGGPGQRACCAGEQTWPGGYHCQPGYQQMGTADECRWRGWPAPPVGENDCLCPDNTFSDGRCQPISPCGGVGQRKCCSFEGHCSGSASYCHEDADCPGGGPCVERGGCNTQVFGTNLRVADICSGDCTCGDASGGMNDNPWKTEQSCVIGQDDAAVIPNGEPETGGSALQAAPTPGRRGYADLHMHLFGNMSSGAGVLAGQPYDRTVLSADRWTGGVASALAQCEATTAPAAPWNDYRDLLGPQLDLVEKWCVDGSTASHYSCEQVTPACDWPMPTNCGDVLVHGDHYIERGGLVYVFPLPLLSDPVGEGTGDRESYDKAIGGLPGHSNFGWPYFHAWPTWSSTTHQQAYYRWLERAWQGGLRLIVQLAVTNESLCKASKRVRSVGMYAAGGDESCEDSMASIDAQIEATKDLERFIDEMHEGDGWFRIVDTPEQADAAIAAGKLAVVLGIEVDNLFNCKLGTCTEDYVRQQVDVYYDKGVRHVFPIHNFENDFGAPAIWGTPLLNAGNKVSEGVWWAAEECDSSTGYTFSINPWDPGWLNWPDLINLGFGYVVPNPGWHPTYTQTATCNANGLSPLGFQLIDALMKSGMTIDIDHMSKRSIDDVVGVAVTRSYPLVAGHVVLLDRHLAGVDDTYRGRHERMRTRTQLEQIRDLDGMVGLMTNVDNPKPANAGEALTAMNDPVENYTVPASGTRVWMQCSRSSQAWVQSLENAIDVMNGPVAFATDFNGLAGHLTPRFGDDGCYKNGFMRTLQHDRLAYPFTLDGFGTFDKQRTGFKEFDFNVDGLAHVGLLPDLIADLEAIGTGGYYIDQLMGSADKYVSMWRKQQIQANEAPTCPAAPAAECAARFAKSVLVVDERTPGKEKVLAKLLAGPALTQASLGDPTVGRGAYSLCVYDEGVLRIQISVDRDADTCGTNACWKSVGGASPTGKGYAFKDRLATASGVQKMVLIGGAARRSKVLLKAANNAAKGRTSLPTGLATALSTATNLEMHVHGSNEACYAAELGDIEIQQSDYVKAKALP